MEAAGLAFTSLSPEELDWMSSIANELSVSGLLASNLLSFLSNAWYHEDIPVIDELAIQEEKLKPELQESSFNQFTLAPNPSNTSVSIQFDSDFSSEGAMVIVTDIFGKALVHQTISDDFASVTVGIGNLPAGIYFVQLKRGNEFMETQKLAVSE